MVKKILLLTILLGTIVAGVLIPPAFTETFNSVEIQRYLTNTMESGVVRANVYKTGITNAANVNIAFHTATDTNHKMGFIAYCDQPVLFGYTTDTLAQVDSTTAQVGGYIPAASWSTFNWDADTLAVKATGANAACYFNVIRYKTDSY